MYVPKHSVISKILSNSKAQLEQQSFPDFNNNSKIMNTALSEDCLLKLVHFISDAKDLLNLSLTCKTLYKVCNQPSPWKNYLQKSFGLQVKYDNLTSLKKACLFLQQQQDQNKNDAENEQQMRFLALYTNGGVQDQSMYFWVDNIFKQTAYCSEFMDPFRSLDIFTVFCGTMQEYAKDYDGYYNSALDQNRSILRVGQKDSLMDVGNLRSRYVLDSDFQKRMCQIDRIQLFNTNGRLTCPVVTGVVFSANFSQSKICDLNANQITENIELELKNFDFFNSPKFFENELNQLPIVHSEKTGLGVWHEFDQNYQWPKNSQIFQNQNNQNVQNLNFTNSDFSTQFSISNSHQNQNSNNYNQQIIEIKPMFAFHFWTKNELKKINGEQNDDPEENFFQDPEEIYPYIFNIAGDTVEGLDIKLKQKWFGNSLLMKLVECQVISVHHQWWQLTNIDLYRVEVYGKSYRLSEGVNFDI